jgi:hypothetical protein
MEFAAVLKFRNFFRAKARFKIVGASAVLMGWKNDGENRNPNSESRKKSEIRRRSMARIMTYF